MPDSPWVSPDSPGNHPHTPPPHQWLIQRLWRRGSGIGATALGATLGLLLFGLRSLAAAGFDSDVARAIVSFSSPTDLVRATVLTFLPIVALFAAWLAAWTAGEIVARSQVKAPRRWVTTALSSPLLPVSVVVAVAALIVIARTEGFDPVTSLVVVGIFLSSLTFGRTSDPHRVAGSPVLRVVLALIATAYCLAAALTSDFWRPTEQLTVTGRGEVVGYVLQEDRGGYAVLLDADRRVVELVPRTDIERRLLCQPSGRLRASALSPCAK